MNIVIRRNALNVPTAIGFLVRKVDARHAVRLMITAIIAMREVVFHARLDILFPMGDVYHVVRNMRSAADATLTHAPVVMMATMRRVRVASCALEVIGSTFVVLLALITLHALAARRVITYLARTGIRTARAASAHMALDALHATVRMVALKHPMVISCVSIRRLRDIELTSVTTQAMDSVKDVRNVTPMSVAGMCLHLNIS